MAERRRRSSRARAGEPRRDRAHHATGLRTELAGRVGAAAAARFREGGGTVVVEPFDIPVGRIVVVADPFENVLVMLELSKGRYATDDLGDVTGVTPP